MFSLAMLLNHRPKSGARIKKHVCLVNDYLTRRLKEKNQWCAESSSIAAQASSVLGKAVKSRHYQQSNGTWLQNVGIGIVRIEIGRRLVCSDVLGFGAPDKHHVETTAAIFKFLDDYIRKTRKKFRCNLFRELLEKHFGKAVKDDKVDLLTWRELTEGHKHLGKLSVLRHIIGVRALFTGRKLQLDEGGIASRPKGDNIFQFLLTTLIYPSGK